MVSGESEAGPMVQTILVLFDGRVISSPGKPDAQTTASVDSDILEGSSYLRRKTMASVLALTAKEIFHYSCR
jgi:hypothetical protein